MSVCRVYSPKASFIPLVGVLLCIALACTSLYCRAEWLDTRQQLDAALLRADMNEESRNYWKRKYESSKKKLTPRQERLLRKYDAANMR